MKAFSGDISGNAITARSDMVNVATDRSFSITNAHAGTRTVFAWQDFNGDGTVNTGDYFGMVSGVVISDNQDYDRCFSNCGGSYCCAAAHYGDLVLTIERR